MDPHLVLARFAAERFLYRLSVSPHADRFVLKGALLRVQVDVGIGDAVVPPPEWLEYPSLLDFARPRLRAYRRETVIAEKAHAMVTLGSRNSRLRDFFDVHALAQRRRSTAASSRPRCGRLSSGGPLSSPDACPSR